MKELKKIIQELKEIRKSEDLQINDRLIFENAVKISLSREIQQYKEKNIQRVKDDRKTHQNKPEDEFEPLTIKQKGFLEKNDYRGDIESLSKKEASNIIKGFIEEKNKGGVY
jgi:hypothetical protein